MIGEILKNKREELGLDLKEVAHTLRIQFEYLKALENNTLEKLPPAVYTRGYIREYARFLSVDPEPLVDEYAGQMAPKEKVQPEPPPEGKKPALPRGIFLLPLIVVLVLAVVIFFPKSKTPSREAGDEHRQPLMVVKPPQLPASEHGKVSPVVAVNTPQLPVSERGKVPSAPASPGARYVLNIIATEATWLRIEMGDGKSEEVLMKPGETKNWTSQNGFDVKLGNAGGVRLALNGKDLGIPGEKGRVVRLRFPQDNPPQQPPG